MTNALARAKTYLDAWNSHDAAAIISTFTNGGVYYDPKNGEICGDAIGANAKSLWESFPDLTFEIVSMAEAGPARVVAEWIMTGTNNGQFAGLPPTGRTVSLPGVDVIDVAADGIKAVRGYFDTRTVLEQLELQVIVQPHTIGPFSFGVSTSVQSGKKVKPGAFSITSIWNENEDEIEEMRALARDTAKEMLGMDGFIGMTFVRIGKRGITITAWEKPENAKQVYTSDAHRESMRRFWSDLGHSAFTSLWTPDHINSLWIRCSACKKMNDYEKNEGICGCGEPLSEPHPYY